MTTTRTDRGSTETTTIYSENGDLTYERIFAAPRETVWRANTEPELVERWWGPHRHQTRVEKLDLRPGGEWRFVSTDTEGNETVVRAGEGYRLPAGWSGTFEALEPVRKVFFLL